MVTGDPSDPAADAARELLGADAVLLDFNGTLSLDEELLESCYHRALIGCRLDGLADGEYAGLLGLSEIDISTALLQTRGQSAADRTDELLGQLAVAYLAACRADSPIPPEHIRVVERLAAAGVPIAIATGTLRRMVEPVLAEVGIGDLLGALVTIEDVACGKPHPETFHRALDQLGVRDPAHVVVCEDSAAGVAAGRAIRAITIGVGPIAGPDRNDALEADYRIGSLAALLPYL